MQPVLLNVVLDIPVARKLFTQLPIHNMKKGFTLLEILVVIGIIAILVALGATSYSTAQKKARDARRKSDLKSIQNALEQYYSICNFQYPFSGTGNLSGSLTCGSTTLITYPTDPLNTS